MKLHEYQAKQTFATYGLPVSRGKVAETPEQVLAVAKEIGKPVVVKAQVHVGGRGKAGGIKPANTPEEAQKIAQAMLGSMLKGLPVNKVLVEEQIKVASELYVSVTMDRPAQKSVILFSKEGGVDIEELAATKPQAIGKLHFFPDIGVTETQVADFLKQWPVQDATALAKFIVTLVKIYKDNDAELVEVNPLAWTTDRGYLALDGKVSIDDNALFRHAELATFQEESETDAIESEAHRRKLAYVRLGGNVGIIGNGAGLVMGTMDEVSRAGGKPANFLDIGGGAKAAVVINAIEILLMDPNVQGIFVNIFGGITRCDEVARGLIEAFATRPVKLPVVIRLAGTNAEEGRKLVAQTKLTPATSMQDGAKKIVELIGAKR